jgi:3',5'-cyclic-AMP phosphodiesterase
MPFVIDRRAFLKQSLIAAGAFAAAGAPAMRARDANGGTVRWALLSDTHIAADPSDTYRGFKPHENLAKVVGQLKESHLDAILVNGDLARLEGKPVDYVRFTDFVDPLADQSALVVTLGNHDDRKNARGALTKLAGERQPVEQKFVTVLDADPVRFVLLDSLMATNITPGQLGKSQRDWLAASLGQNPAKPTIVFVHHNPDPESDGGLVDADRLLALLKSQRQVKALFFGHLHIYRHTQLDGLHLINLPAVGYNFADGEVVGWLEASFTGQDGELKLHAIGGDMKNDGQATKLQWR